MPQKGQITIKQNSGTLKAGDILTFNGQIISCGGQIMHSKGDTGEIEYIDAIDGYWSNLCPDIWIAERVNAIKLVGISGHWTTSTFFETQNRKP